MTDDSIAMIKFLRSLLSLIPFAWKVLQFCLLGVSCLFTLTGFFGDYFWFFDLTNHFKFQYFGVALLALMLFLIRWDTKSLSYWSLPILLCLVINGALISPYFFEEEPVSKTSLNLTQDESLKLLHMNVLKFNHDYKAVAKEIQKYDPHILSLQEVDKRWLKRLNELGALKKYPYRGVHPSTQNGLYSRIPLDSLNIELVPDAQDGIFIERGEGSILVAKFYWNNELITLLNFHPATPVTAGQYRGQQRHFETLIRNYKAKNAQDSKEHLIVVGDLNTTPWSSAFQRLTQELSLKDTRLGRGLKPTWPAILPLALIPIDHVLVSKNIVALKQETGSFVGSDHLPLYVELALR